MSNYPYRNRQSLKFCISLPFDVGISMDLTQNTRSLLELLYQTTPREWDLTWNALRNETTPDGTTVEAFVVEMLVRMEQMEQRTRSVREK